MTKLRMGKPTGLALAGLLAAASAVAGSANYDFNAAPPAELNFVGNAEWRDTGGKTGGYMALFDSIGSQHASVLMPDFDKGLIVAGFTFEVDLRVGNAVGNGGRPADGFSISYARANDAVVADLSQEPPVDNMNSFAVAGGPENGTATGLAISFDTWSGNTLPDGADLEGIIIRVDNKTLLVNGQRGIAMPTRNGTCEDATSMQTGPWDEAANGAPDGLCWAPLKVVLAENGELTVTWKGVDIVNKVQTGFAPSAGRIVLAGRTGGANENTHIDNLKITTIPALNALYGGGTATAEGYTLKISDSGASVVKQDSIKVKIDGVAVTPTAITKDAGVTTISVVTAPTYLASGSVHPCEVIFDDNQGKTGLGGTKDVTVAAYVDITADMAVTGVSTAAGNRGFIVRSWYVANADGTPMGDLANTTQRTEQELFGELGVNQADDQAAFTQTIPGTSNKYVKEPEYLNHEETGVQSGMFTDVATDPQRAATEKIIPGITAAVNNLAVEALFFAEFSAPGLYTFGCNSDDGFALFAGKNPLDRFQVDGKLVVEYSGGRGTDATGPQTLGSCLVRTPGIYPMRFTFEEGGGGTSFELYQKLTDGSLALVNDTTRASSVVKAYWDGPRTARAYISKVSPGVGVFDMALTDPLEITLSDDGTTVVDGSVKLTVNGIAVTPTVSKSGKNTTVKYTPTVNSPCWKTGPNAINIKYDESGGGKRDQSFDLTVRPSASKLPSTAFVIEAEHFDYDNGKAMLSTGTGYTGDEYNGLAAVHNVDFYQDGTVPDSDLYRTGEAPNVPMDVQNAASPDLDMARPGFDVTTNYKIGWAGNGEWYNYTRTIPAGVYGAYGASSIDPSGTAGGDLGLVTAGAGTATQTVKLLANVRGTPPGGWGNNALMPAIAANGTPVPFHLPGGKVTLRFTTQGGDFDWFALVPLSGVQAKITSKPWEATDRSIRRDGLKFAITDFNTTVATDKVKLSVDGTDVTGTSTISKAGMETSVAGPLLAAGTHAYVLEATDSGGQKITASGSVRVNPFPTAGSFVIEAEDFDYDNGKANPKKGTVGQDVDVMPYLGGAYTGLAAVDGVDYERPNEDSNGGVYRATKANGLDPHVPISNVMNNYYSKDRGSYEVTANYTIGWGGDARWYNYTREVPAGNYEMWFGGSHDGRGEHMIKLQTEFVAGGVTNVLGAMDVSATGGWGANDLFPLLDGSGNKAVVALSGKQTIRLHQTGEGDLDFMVLVPSGTGPAVKIDSIKLNADGSATITWSGGGILQAAEAITGPWQDVTDVSPYTFTPTAAQKALFGRIKK